MTTETGPGSSSLLSFKTTQTLYFVRHGAAEHNVPIVVNGVQTQPSPTDPKYTDPKLVHHGHNQARNAGMMLQRALHKHEEQQLRGILCSPLTRCLETTGDIAEVVECGGQWTVREDLREAFGAHYPDKRSQRSCLEACWPHVNFGDMSEEDKAWRPDRRESLVDVQNRIDRFFTWVSWNQLHYLSTVVADNVDTKDAQGPFLIVSHGVWMECMLRKYCPSILEGNRRVYNCDIYRSILVCHWQRINFESQWRCKGIHLESTSLIHSNYHPQMN